MGKKSRDKKREKVYDQIKSIVDSKIEVITSISPLKPYVNGLQDISSRGSVYDGTRLYNERGLEWSATNAQEEHRIFCVSLCQLLYTDIAVEKYGIKEALQNREDAFILFTHRCIGFSTQKLVDIIKGINTLQMLSDITNARVRQRLYYECDDLSNDAGRQLARLCFKDISYNNMVDMLTLETNKLSRISTPTLKEHMMARDARMLENLLSKGLPITLYRGFLIDPLDMVRGEGKRIDDKTLEDDYLGKKTDGDEYFRKWNAGKGVSFTFDEDIAGWFCYWGITHGGKYTYNKGGWIGNIWSKKKKVDRDIRTREEYIRWFGDTYSKRIDKVGLKPIVCKLLVDPKDIKGFNFGKTEREINLLPEHAKVIHYEILSGRKIAEHCWNCLNKGAGKTSDLMDIYSKTKVVIFNFQQNGKNMQIFADKDDIEDKVEELKRKYYNGEIENIDNQELREIFANAAIELPRQYRSLKLTKSFWDFLLRKPERKLRSKGQAYQAYR